METLVMILLILLIVAVREGMQLADRKFNSQRYSDGWHRLGAMMRMLAVFAIVLLTKHTEYMWYWFALGCVLAWPVYNITINLFRRDKWYYVGKKGIDGVIRKCLPFVKFDKQ